MNNKKLTIEQKKKLDKGFILVLPDGLVFNNEQLEYLTKYIPVFINKLPYHFLDFPLKKYGK